MTKSEISKQLRTLTKANYLVFTWNSNRRMRGACQGWPDHGIIDRNNGKLWLLEVKIGHDRLDALQQRVGDSLKALSISSNYHLNYRVVNENNFSEVFDEITGG